MSAFRAYDVRGVYPGELDEELMYKIGKATAIFFGAKKLAVGRDGRESSPALTKTLIYALTDQGVNVVDVGLCSTPMIYYAGLKNHAAMVTASHNPPEYNGLKVVRKGLESVGAENGLKKIEKLTMKHKFPQPAKRGRVFPKNILAEYVKHTRKIIGGRYKKLNVIVDCGNGMAGYVAPTLFKGLKLNVSYLYPEIDPRFPNHVPNPMDPKNTKDLQKEVKKKKADIGIAYDGDCDRVMFIDEKGNRIRADHALVLLARHFFKRKGSIAHTQNCSKVVPEALREMGAKPIITKVGRTNVQAAMIKNKCVFGGELTGHYFFKKFNYADSGDLAALAMLAYMSKEGQKLSELIEPLKKYANAEEVKIKVKNQDKALKKVEKEFKGQKISKLDGLSIDADDFWFNLRKSNTEPVLKLNMEAVSRKVLKQEQKSLLKIVTK